MAQAQQITILIPDPDEMMFVAGQNEANIDRIEREFGVRYSEVHVWRLLGQLGLSNQKPDRRALERDAPAIEKWRKRTWPAVKKTPHARDD